METIKEILDYMNGYRVTGEDGGIVLQDLKELEYKGLTVSKDPLQQTIHLDLGEVRYYGLTQQEDKWAGKGQLDLYVFENKEYKFICIEDTQVEVSPGGTCYIASVEIYIKGEE